MRSRKRRVIFGVLLSAALVAMLRFVLQRVDKTLLQLHYHITREAVRYLGVEQVTDATNKQVSTPAEIEYSRVEGKNTQSELNSSAAAASVQVPPASKSVGVPRVNATLKKQTVEFDECRWANFTVKGPPYFLTVVFIARIYEDDLSEMTTAEVKQWLVYLRYAGVQHVYLYDLWYLPGEAQREPLDVFIREGYLTYIDRHELNPYVRQKSQLPSYQHCIDVYGKDSVWQTAIDIDEYPFSPEDTSPGFLSWFVDKYSTQNPSVSEITMQNFLYLGTKNKSKEFLIDQLWRHTHGPSNALVKPIYKPVDITRAQVHHNVRARGQTRDAPSSSLRMNHYWGARLQNWGPDTEESLAKTEEDRGMEPILAAFEKCEQYIRNYL